MRDVAARDSSSIEALTLGDRGVEAPQLGLRILGDEVRDDDARLVQHDMAEPDAVGERRAALMQRAPERGRLPGRERLQLARGDHLGEHHGGGLERLDLLVGVDPVRPVLDDEHAERVAGPQDRHAEEGVVDLLAGLRPVGEGRVRLGVGER